MATTMEQKTNKYFNYLCSFVYDDGFLVGYTKLLRQLFETEFIYSDLDKNRVGDGISLRYRFDPDNYHSYLDDMPISVLEILIALALRCEETIMYNESYGNRLPEWFWEMITNIGVARYTDDRYDDKAVAILITKFMTRDYGPTGQGQGCAFRTKKGEDLTNVELWYQMQRHLIDILGV